MEEPKGFQPPYNLEAEQAVLGAILINSRVMDDLQGLEAEDFYRDSHGQIFKIMAAMHARNEIVDLQTVTFRLKDYSILEEVGGFVFLAGLTEQVGTSAHANHYALVVKNKALLRRLMNTCQEIIGASQEYIEDVPGFIDKCEARLFQLTIKQGAKSYSMEEIVPEEIERLENIYNKKVDMLGLSSGYPDIDHLTGGFQNSDLIILAARPSMGKTALALSIATNIAESGSPGAFFSLEMARGQLVHRSLSSRARIPATRLRDVRLSMENWADVQAAAGDLMQLPIYIIDKPAMTMMDIRSQARRLKARNNIQWVVVDYLQLMKDPKARSREQEVSSFSSGLKALAKELSIPVIALSQLNRKVEERTNRRPVMSDLRESGAIEQDADLIFFLYRDRAYRQDGDAWAELQLAKQRNGPLGMVRLTYLSEIMRFESFTE
jgi:replicative DNA helicase